MIDNATTRYKHIKERKETIDNSRLNIGRTSEFTKKSRYEFESGRKSHLESVEEEKVDRHRRAGTKKNLVKQMTTFLGDFGMGMEGLVEPQPQEGIKKEKWNLAKVIGRDIF